MTKTSFGLTCPRCGEPPELGMSISPNDLSSIHCFDCDQDMDVTETVALAVDQARRWKAFAAWLATAEEWMPGEDEK